MALSPAYLLATALFNPKEVEAGKRELIEMELVEISPVEAPADNAAHVGSVKSVIDEAKSLKITRESCAMLDCLGQMPPHW